MMITVLEKEMSHKMLWCVCLIVALCTSCNGKRVELVNNGRSNNLIRSDDTLYHLDVSKPSVTQPIEPGSVGQDGAKFVQVEVTEVLNPKRSQLTFEVRYQAKNNEKTYLGSFSLYPADKPGKFIVATQGKVKDEGAIVLSLVIPGKIDTLDTIKVTVKKMKLLKG